MKRCYKNLNILITGIAAFAAFLLPSLTSAQGSVFGTVHNSGGSIPVESALGFIGFIDNSDSEVRIEECFGAGYDVTTAGNWYDDFQNYSSESSGIPYSYRFYNFDNNQGYILNGIIPNNSYEQENVTLQSVSWPAGVFWVQADLNDDGDLSLIWDYTPGQLYHIYRRDGSSDGSFFRIDNSGNQFTDGGVDDSIYYDVTAVDGEIYDYLIVPRIGTAFGPHSEVYTFQDAPFLCGDVNNDGIVNILDILELVDYKFRGAPAPINLAAGEVDGNSPVNILDIIFLVNYKFRDGPEPTCSLHIDIH